MNEIEIYVDGGSRGNPGQGAIGVFVISDGNKILAEIGEKIGYCTNNQAEYKALLKALDWLVMNQKKLERANKITLFLDSQLVYYQVTGLFKIKNAIIRDMIFEIRQKEAKIKIDYVYKHILREKNKEADRLVNLALDNLL